MHVHVIPLLQEMEDTGEPPLSPFHGHGVPQISIRDYVMRISKYSQCSNICCVMAYSYMQRLAKVGSNMSSAQALASYLTSYSAQASAVCFMYSSLCLHCLRQ